MSWSLVKSCAERRRSRPCSRPLSRSRKSARRRRRAGAIRANPKSPRTARASLPRSVQVLGVLQISGRARAYELLMPTSQLTSRRLALLSGFALLGVLGAVSVCNAESPWRRRVAPSAPPPYRVWRVSLEDQDGAALPTFRQAGQRFVLG